MHYSCILCLVLMTNLSLSSASFGRKPEDHQKSSYDEVPGDEIVNIGNGVNRKNNVFIDERPEAYSGPHKNSRPHQSTTNIGNGYNNRNTVVIGNREHETSFSEQTNPQVGNTGGTTFVRNRNNGFDTYHVGYGTNNQNKISVGSNPLEPDCYGSRCDNVKETLRISGAAKTNQAISLVLCFLNLFYLILI